MGNYRTTQKQINRTEPETETSGWKAIACASAAFAFLAIVCVVAYETDLSKALGDMFKSIEGMSSLFHLCIILLGVIAGLAKLGRGEGDKWKRS